MIVVVGDVMTDVIVRPVGPLAQGTDCPAGIVLRQGGSGANIACWIGHLGGAVAFAGRVGARHAEGQRALFLRYGATPHLAADEAAPTGTTVAIIDGDGERSFYTDRGANMHLCGADLPESLLDEARWLHVSGHTLSAAGPREAALRLMDAARARGVKFSVDAGSRLYLERMGAAAFFSRAENAGICFANHAEAALLGQVPPATCMLVVTEGAAGARALSAGAVVRVDAPQIAVADTIGAGDAFTAGFLVAHLSGKSLVDCLREASAAAAMALATDGGRPPL